MTVDFINSMPQLTVNDEVKQLIDSIVEVSEAKDDNNVNLRKVTLALIDKYRVDFPNILNKVAHSAMAL